jgi:hypothetical protein
MKDKKPEKMITVTLEESAASRPAVFCKRVLIERAGPFASGNEEAWKMLRALEDPGVALEGRGFSPRQAS